MPVKINVSFKNTDDDMKLYLSVADKSDKSAFIKDALKFYIRYRHLETQLEEMVKNAQKNKAYP